MKIISFSSSRADRFRKLRGFSLLEILIVIAALSSVSAMAFVHMSGTADDVKKVKLKQDVAALNDAIRTYLISGGNLDSATTGDAVISKLKTTATSAQRASMAGLRGSMIDLRLRGVPSSGNGPPRAVWNKTKKAFVLGTSGAGISEFKLEEEAVPATPTEEERKVLMAMNTKDKWIWGFDDQTKSATGPRTTAETTATPVIAANNAVSPTVLKSPDFSKPGALYDFDDFAPDMKVSIVDRNAANTSDTFYSIANGPWLRWTGTPLSIPRALATSLRAYSTPLNPDKFEQSAVVDALYETLYFAGTNTGLFGDPVALSNLDPNSNVTPSAPTSIANRKDTFLWGTAAGTGYSRNKMVFTSKVIGVVPPETWFDLGTLTYTNGTTTSGTNASFVNLYVTVNLTIPQKVSDVVPFQLKLNSTVNNKPNPFTGNAAREKIADDADADYVEFISNNSKLDTEFKGQKYYLALSFENNNVNGYTTPNTFHTHEGKTMSGTVKGKFTKTPPVLP